MQEKLRNGLFVFLIVLLPVLASASVHSDRTSPHDMLRDLQQLQDEIAVGKADALTKQAHAVAMLGAQLRKAHLSVFGDARNVYALITYLFSGGDPGIVASLLQRIPEGQVSRHLIEGALAYAYNRRDDFLAAFATSELKEADWPETLRLSLYLSLIPDQAHKDPISASAWLDYIRLAVPGSLFEEAAIRRQVRLAAILDDIKKIHLLVRNYSDRFSDSLYADNFWNELVTVLPMVDDRLTDASLDGLVSMTPLRIQYLAYLYVARSALINGRMERAFHGAAQADKLAVKLRIDNTTARLYYAASQAGTLAAPRAARMLQAIRADDLEERDRPLLDAARFVAKGVVHYPESIIADALLTEKEGSSDGDVSPWHDVTLEPFALPDMGKHSATPEPGQQNGDKSDKIADFLEKAQEKLNVVDQLLKKEGK